MDLKQILNADTCWKGGRPSLNSSKPMGFTNGSRDSTIHQKTHQVNAFSLRPLSEHKRNNTICSISSICSFDTPPRSFSGPDLRPDQYESEQLCCSSSRHSAPQKSGLNGVQPATSFVATSDASTVSSSSDDSLTQGDLHIRPPRGAYDPSIPFQGERIDIHQKYQNSIVPGCSTLVEDSLGQRNACRSAENMPSNNSSTEVSPMTMRIQSPVAIVDPLPLGGEKICSFLENCSTESPERKVTSHIFGRNKSCTKQIPNAVWLWYCRKHYQRSRYRDRVAFTRKQLHHVRRQVDRLETWGGVTEWYVILKKSEQKRLDEENAELAKIALDDHLRSNGGSTGSEHRGKEAGPTLPKAILEAEPPASLVSKQMQNNEENRNEKVNGDDEVDGDDENDHKSKKSKGRKKNPKSQKNKKKVVKKTVKVEPPVCRWMVPYLGQGKTFADIRALLNVVENYIQQTKYQFPNIEILPQSDPAAVLPPPSSTTQLVKNPQRKGPAKRKASDSASESSTMSPPTSRKRRSPDEDNSDESGDRSTGSPCKRRSIAGGSTNASNTMAPASAPKRRSAAGSKKKAANVMPLPSPPKRRTLTRGCQTPPAAMSAAKQGKQPAKRNTATRGGRR